MKELSLFTDDCDTVIAYDLDDAMEVLREYGYTDPDPEAFGPMSDGDMLEIHCDAQGVPCEPGSQEDVGTITRTAAGWAASRPRGFLCTTEF